MLQGKHILLGVSGSIAAYKAAYITRLLVKNGASVKVVMTEASSHFITPLTLSTLSGNPVITDFVNKEEDSDGTWNNHVELGLWADAMLVAPATANTLADFVAGQARSYLTAVYLSARCPVFIAPAMDVDMYKHPSTKENVEKLVARGVELIPPGVGELASGLEGEGRLAEPEEVVKYLENYFLARSPLAGKTVMVTAGPTYEPIDPVRFVGNHSSGKMGFAIAEVAARMGARVILISGPTALSTPKGNIARTDVVTAQDMYEASLKALPEADIIIMSAAVADYTPEQVAHEKIKKTGGDLSITLKPTQDILKELGRQKKASQCLVGFALETENEETNALKKLAAKNLDLIVLNSLRQEGAGFATDTNRVTVFDKDNNKTDFELKTKQKIAKDILDKVVEYVAKK